jgi:hypothetical protein
VDLKTKLSIAAALGALAACASGTPPRQELENARMALAQASPIATKDAPKELATAQDKLKRAESAMQKEKFDEARMFARQAEADAKLAWAVADNARVQRQAEETQKANQTLREELERKSQ